MIKTKNTVGKGNGTAFETQNWTGLLEKTWSSCSLNISIQSFWISRSNPLKKCELCWRIWKHNYFYYLIAIWNDLQYKMQYNYIFQKNFTWKFKRWLATRWIKVITFSLVTRRFLPPGMSSSSVCSPYSLFTITKYSSNSEMSPL